MALIHSFLIGVTAGSRAMTPLATVAHAAGNGTLPRDNGASALLGIGLVPVGTLALAVGELAGDKMESAPDRIVIAGMAARITTGAIAGAAFAPSEQRAVGALLGATAAAAAAYLTFDLRRRAMSRYGQTPTGLVEDALTVGAAILIARSAAVS